MYVKESLTIPVQVAEMFANTKSKWPHGAQLILYTHKNDVDNDRFDNTNYIVDTNNSNSNNSSNAKRDMSAEGNAIGGSSNSYTNDYIGPSMNVI